MLTPAALQPPRTRWDGPQPGLFEQTDSRHRYFFSKKHGRIESVICYTEQGTPICRVEYKNPAPEQLIPVAAHRWNGANFEYAGTISETGDIISSQVVPNEMIDSLGAKKTLPCDGQHFITPAGFVVSVLQLPRFFRKMRSEYVGRLVAFAPEQPFHMQTPSGTRIIPPHASNIFIGASGAVFEAKKFSLRAIGQLLPYKIAGERSQRLIKFANELLAVAMQGGEITARVLHPEHQAFVRGAAPVISGGHPFLKKETPELTHPDGAETGELALREVEHAALQLALIIRALETPMAREPHNHGLLIAAHTALETRLWNAAAAFEAAIGATPHSVLSREFVRAWVRTAAQNPRAAVTELAGASAAAYAD